MASFKNLRNDKGLTTEHIAKSLGIKINTYRKYECYVRLPNASILAKMPSIYKCTAEAIIQAYNNAREVQIERYGKTNP